MKRYLVFLYNSYYPEGGMKDFYDSYGSIEAISEAIEVRDDERGYIRYYAKVNPINKYDSFKHESHREELECECLDIIDTTTWESIPLPDGLVIPEDKQY
jgi:hypothetical protein